MKKEKRSVKALALALVLTLLLSMTVQAETVDTEKAAKSNPKVWRALCIGESNYGSSRLNLPACRNDAYAMGRVLRKTGYKFAKVRINRTKSQIQKLIKSTFKYADSNDVSFFYYSGHGASNGSLVTVRREYISPATLAGWLKKIPGTVIVMADCCYSGALINKSADGKITVQNPKEFNTNFVNAFAANDLQAKAGEFCKSKFKVLTACKQYEISYCTSRYSLFTEKLISGAGYSYDTGRRFSYAPADYNRNRKITLSECRRYTFLNIYRQNAQCYPTYSEFKIFQR